MDKYNAFYTYDGSVGLYSKDSEDIYHSVTGALTESVEKFIIPANIPDLLSDNKEVKVLDICFGIGYNSKSFLNFILKNFKKIFEKNFEVENKNLSVCNDKIYTNKFFKEKYINTVHNNKIFDTSENCKHIDKIYANKNYEHNVTNQHDNINNQNIYIKAVDIDKNLAFLSPFIKNGVKNTEKFNKNVKNVKLKNLLRKYKTSKNNNFLEKFEKLYANNFIYLNTDKLPVYPDAICLYIYCKLITEYKDEFISNDYYNFITDKDISVYLSAKFKLLYKLLYFSEHIFYPLRLFFAFLHNIYYMYLSKRYKKDLNTLRMLNIDFNLKINDARTEIKGDNNLYDIVFLDGFTPSKCPSLWSYEFLKLLSEHLSANGVILTYTTSAPVRNAFIEAGLFIGNILSSDKKTVIGTIASKNQLNIKNDLSEFDLRLVKTKSGIIYHDENLNMQNEEILSRRNTEVKKSDLISVSELKRSFDKA